MIKNYLEKIKEEHIVDEKFKEKNIYDITTLLGNYFDGLYAGDIKKFSNIFHEQSHLYFADGENITDWSRSVYFEKISSRVSPLSQGLARNDKIVSINIAGPNTAFAVVNCAIPPRYFTDYLSLLRTSNGWRIISKTFHTDSH